MVVVFSKSFYSVLNVDTISLARQRSCETCNMVHFKLYLVVECGEHNVIIFLYNNNNITS